MERGCNKIWDRLTKESSLESSTFWKSIWIEHWLSTFGEDYKHNGRDIKVVAEVPHYMAHVLRVKSYGVASAPTFGHVVLKAWLPFTRTDNSNLRNGNEMVAFGCHQHLVAEAAMLVAYAELTKHLAKNAICSFALTRLTLVSLEFSAGGRSAVCSGAPIIQLVQPLVQVLCRVVGVGGAGNAA